MFCFNWLGDCAAGASIPSFSRYIGERFYNANAEFDFCHRGCGF
jgi:hypothetical protein